jgi:hypothetical protein
MCDNPVVGKHLVENTRLLAEIYCSLRYVFGYILACFSLRYNVKRVIVTTPQPPYGGSHREANNGSDGLGALAATLYSRSYVLPDYGILLAVRTELHT